MFCEDIYTEAITGVIKLWNLSGQGVRDQMARDFALLSLPQRKRMLQQLEDRKEWYYLVSNNSEIDKEDKRDAESWIEVIDEMLRAWRD